MLRVALKGYRGMMHNNLRRYFTVLHLLTVAICTTQ